LCLILILVVEDEPRVREMAVSMLEEIGYPAVFADSAEAGMKQLAAHPEITLVLTDIVMPGVSGRKFADQALAAYPRLKVMYMTGFTRNAIVHNGLVDPGVQLIQKPFSLEDLSHKLAEVLSAK
jgi:CheY-like chemotaxis protein